MPYNFKYLKLDLLHLKRVLKNSIKLEFSLGMSNIVILIHGDMYHYILLYTDNNHTECTCIVNVTSF